LPNADRNLWIANTSNWFQIICFIKQTMYYYLISQYDIEDCVMSVSVDVNLYFLNRESGIHFVDIHNGIETGVAKNAKEFGIYGF